MSTVPKVYYRVDGYVNEDDNGVFVASYPVISETKAGVWVEGHGLRHFVLNGDGKRWAYPTEAAAWESFAARKAAQLHILAAHHDRAKRTLEGVKAYLDKGAWPGAPRPLMFAFDL